MRPRASLARVGLSLFGEGCYRFVELVEVDDGSYLLPVAEHGLFSNHDLETGWVAQSQ